MEKDLRKYILIRIPFKAKKKIYFNWKNIWIFFLLN